jgi:hypothetical protein
MYNMQITTYVPIYNTIYCCDGFAWYHIEDQLQPSRALCMIDVV